MEFRLLGDFEVAHEGAPVPVRGPKQRALLALLALRRGEVVPAEQIAEMLWGDAPPANPANALQAQVSALRKLLPEPVLVTKGSGYALDIEPDQLDIGRFDAMVAEARHLLGGGDARRAAEQLRAALELWRGPALADFSYEDFARLEIVRLEEDRLAAIEARVEADLAAGRHADLVAELEALCAAHPLRERLWEHRMVALYRSGRQAEALRAFGEARERLVEELGIEPGPELRRLEAMILAQDEALGAPVAPRREASARGNLRSRLTTFVGRDVEAKDIADLLERHRLVTLVGPGGAGKTRLAVEAADRCSNAFADGAWLVELASVTDPAGVVTAISTALGVSDAATARDRPADPVDRIIGFLLGRELLVVLDNCEHLVAEAATVVDALLGSAPGLRVLATSREALGVPGEALFPVPPLPEPVGVELFVDRAQAVDRTFLLSDDNAAVVAEICNRLDGLPLAIELAAARLRALPLRILAARLDDRFRLLSGGARTALPRHQTLRAVVDWSYDLLFADEQRLFERLCVFPGGCTTAAAEAVCGDEDLPAVDVVDLLARLVDKSLVVVDVDADGEPRYRQLQTLWQYAREKLAESGDATAVRDRHAAWYRALAAGAEKGLRGATGPTWRVRIAAEIDNLRAALDWLIDSGDAPGACGLARNIAWWWFLRADWPEGARWLADALATAGPIADVERARTEVWHAYFAAVIDEPTAYVDAGRAALEIVRAHGSAPHVGEAALLHASTLNRALRFEEALEVLRVAHAAEEEARQPWGLAIHDLLLASATARLGRFDEAERAARSSVEQFDAIGERWATVEPMGTIAAVREARGDIEGAIAAYDRVIATTRPLELPGYLAFWLIARGCLATRLGDDETAVAHFAEAIELSRNPLNTAIALVGRARSTARLCGPARGAASDLQRAEELFAAVGRRDGRAGALVAAGLVRMERHDGGDAAGRDRSELTDLLDRAIGHDPAMAGLLVAAVAAARGQRQEASVRLAEWDEAHLPAMPGSIAAVLQRDSDRLRAAVAG